MKSISYHSTSNSWPSKLAPKQHAHNSINQAKHKKPMAVQRNPSKVIKHTMRQVPTFPVTNQWTIFYHNPPKSMNTTHSLLLSIANKTLLHIFLRKQTISLLNLNKQNFHGTNTTQPQVYYWTPSPQNALDSTPNNTMGFNTNTFTRSFIKHRPIIINITVGLYPCQWNKHQRKAWYNWPYGKNKNKCFVNFSWQFLNPLINSGHSSRGSGCKQFYIFCTF